MIELTDLDKQVSCNKLHNNPILEQLFQKELEKYTVTLRSLVSPEELAIANSNYRAILTFQGNLKNIINKHREE